jgi:hypothetical protein
MIRKAKQSPARPLAESVTSTPKPRWHWAVISLVLAISAVVAVLFFRGKQFEFAEPLSALTNRAPAPRALTFTKDVAPIIFNKCSFCHRPGQSGPFSLLTYKEVKDRAKVIHDVLRSGFMPPWLPEPGDARFVGDRSLTPQLRGIILQWLAEGAPEGRPEDLPALPKWFGDWQLGPPDLIVSLPCAYTLPAEGKDIYRNFVVPIPGLETRYVRAIEFHPGNSKVVHHAFVEIDASRQSRYLTSGSQPPSFEGMQLPPSVHTPMGQFLTWQPGKAAMQSPQGFSWVLEKRSDLVLQLHMHPSGKPEAVLPSVGFYFTSAAPTNSLFRLELAHYSIDIPPGQRDYQIENSYVLPADVDLLRINPHAHYLGKRLEGWAVLPDGTRKELLLIKNWDFNWQGDYLYQEPISLPKGTTLNMRFSYDNSAQNIHNPSQPPKRVRYGPQTTDEMGELWFQVLPHNLADLAILTQDFFLKFTQENIEGANWRLQSDPNDATAHAALGSELFALGRVGEAVQHLRAAVSLDPGNPMPHSQLGGIYLRQQLLAQAQQEFEAVLRANPQDYEAQGSLGLICMQQGRYGEAEAFFERALELNPEDTLAQANLKALRNARPSQR